MRYPAPDSCAGRIPQPREIMGADDAFGLSIGQEKTSVKAIRRIPFRRDVVFDPGGATAPRITVPHMLPSTLMNGSASAILWISRLNLPPHRIAVYASQSPSPTTTQHLLSAACYGPTRAGLPPAGTRQLFPPCSPLRLPIGRSVQVLPAGAAYVVWTGVCAVGTVLRQLIRATKCRSVATLRALPSCTRAQQTGWQGCYSGFCEARVIEQGAGNEARSA
jgi:hypothetical protein